MDSFKKNNKSIARRIGEAGNVFLMLFGAVGMVGVLGASTMTVMKGPVKTMSTVTKRTIAENNMIATGKLALIASAAQAQNDCDGDQTIEPIAYTTSSDTDLQATNGGEVPSTIGAAKQDPWGKNYAYCVWDNGSNVDISGGSAPGCSANYQSGATNEDGYVLAVISAGPDANFQTTCDTGGSFTKPTNSDDIVLGYTYAEASTLAAGLWNIKAGDPDVAEITKDLEITNSSGDLAFGISDVSGNPSIQVDYISELTGSANVEFLSGIEGIDIDLTGDLSAADLAASGTLGVTGTSTLGVLNAGASTLASAGVTGNATVGGTLGVTGVSTLGILNAGASTLNSLGVTNNATIGGTLGATGATTLSSTLDVTGVSTLDDDLTVGSTALFVDASADQVAVGNADTDGSLTITGATDIASVNTAGQGSIVLQENAANATGRKLRIDENEFQASNGGATSSINLNPYGGNIVIGAVTASDLVMSGGNVVMGGGRVLGLNEIPTSANEATAKSYVDALVGSVTGTNEVDPQVDDITTVGSVCTTDGTAIQCTDTLTSLETDPQVGALTAGRFCRTDGTEIICDQDSDDIVSGATIAIDDLSDGYYDGAKYNLGLGQGAVNPASTGSFNNALGAFALNDNTTGNGNIALGYNSLALNTSGNYNIALGFASLYNNTTGTENTALGHNALRHNVAKRFNTAVGFGALRYADDTTTTSDARNTAVGYQAIKGSATASANTGIDNTTVGFQTMYINTTGSNNTAIGTIALHNNTTGSNNTALGFKAGELITTGNDNIIIGYDVDPSSATASNELNIGDIFFGSGTGTTAGSKVGAVEYCDETLTDCFLATDVAGGSLTAIELADGDMDTKVEVDKGDLDDDTIRFSTAGSEHMTIDPVGRIFMGDSQSVLSGYTGRMQMYSNAGALADFTIGSAGTSKADIDIFRTRGAVGSETAVVSGDEIGTVRFSGYDGDSLEDKAFVMASVDGVVSDGIIPTALKFATTAIAGNPIDRLIIASNGTVSIEQLLDMTSGKIVNLADPTNAQDAVTLAYLDDQIGTGVASIQDADGDTMIQVEQGADDDTIRFDTAGTERMTINPTGQVGIGIDPTEPLSVVLTAGTQPPVNTGDIARFIHNGTANSYADVRIIGGENGGSFLGFGDKDDEGSGGILYSHVDNDLAFRVNTSERMTISSSGVVSIENLLDMTSGKISNVLDPTAAQDAATKAYVDSEITTATASGSSAINDLSDGYYNSGLENLGLGDNAMNGSATGNKNIAVGNQSLRFNSTGTANAAFGGYTLDANTTGQYNVAIGHAALSANVGGHGNTALGNAALLRSQSSSDNTALGRGSMQFNISGAENTAVGTYSLNDNTTGNDNVAVGRQALSTNKGISQNTAVGSTAMQFANNWTGSTNANNTAVGFAALRGSTTASANTGVQNTAIGASALTNTTSGLRNSAVGYLALTANTTGQQNTAIGYRSLYLNTTGNNNIALGDTAGDNITTGSNNITIGQNINAVSATGSNQLNIGDLIRGDMANDVVMIGTTSNYSNTNMLQMVGSGRDVALFSYADSQHNGGDYEIYRARGTEAAPTIVENNSKIGAFRGKAYDGSSFRTAGAVEFYMDGGTPSTSNMQSKISFSNVRAGNALAQPVMEILHSGDLLLHGEGWTDTEGCIRYNDTSDKLEFSHDCSSFSEIGAVASGTVAINDLSDAAHNTAQNNLFLGHDGGSFGATDADNVAIGIDSLISLNNSGAENNVAIGGALPNLVSGSDNVGIGVWAQRDAVATIRNVAVGVAAMRDNVAQTHNVAVGYLALGYASDSTTPVESYNTAVGYSALRGATTGSNTGIQNTAVGADSLRNNTSGADNTAVGHWALRDNTSGYKNTAVGQGALALNTTGLSNTAGGYGSQTNTTTGSYNTSFGRLSAFENTIASFNVAIGHGSLQFGKAMTANTAVGTYAMFNANDTGTAGFGYNTALGYEALKGGPTPSANTGVQNTAIGVWSLKSATTGQKNTAVGLEALENLTTGQNNTALGMNAGDAITTGQNNIMLGKDANVSAAGASNELNIGDTLFGNLSNGKVGADEFCDASLANCFTAASVAGGAGAGAINDLSDGYANYTSNNIFLGQNVGNGGTTTGDDNIAIGRDTLPVNTTGSESIAIGIESLRLNTTGYQNIAVGFKALEANTSGFTNVAIGRNTLNDNTVGRDNIAIGDNTAWKNTTGIRLTAVGARALAANTTGKDNVGFGAQTLFYNTVGVENSAVGNHALMNSTGSWNSAFGAFAMNKNTSGNNNTGIGRFALYDNTTGSRNVTLGHDSGQNVTSGNDNILIGYKVSENLTTGSNNIIIGPLGTNTPTATSSNALNIGNVIKGDLSANYVQIDNTLNIVGQAGAAPTFADLNDLDDVNTSGVATNDCLKYNAGTWFDQGCTTSFSDERLKDIAGDYKKGLKEIMALHTVEYKYKKDNPLQLDSSVAHKGFIAQEVREVFPEAVAEGTKGYLELNTDSINVAMVNAVQELKADNDNLRAELSELKASNAEILKAIDSIGAKVGYFDANRNPPSMASIGFGTLGFLFGFGVLFVYARQRKQAAA